MNKKFSIHLLAALAGICALYSCKPPSESLDERSKLSESKLKEITKTGPQKSQTVRVIESVVDLKVELERVAQGSDESRLLESALIHSRRLDEATEAWDGTSTILATQFIDLAPNGNPSDEFFEKLGLAGHNSEQKPSIEVEVLVRTLGALASNRPDLFQELLLRMSRDRAQTESDLVVYTVALESVMEDSGAFRRLGYEGIAALRESENPVYRLLVAKLMTVLEHDLRSLAAFYSPYMLEKDETILLAAIDGLTTAGTLEALGMLQEIAGTGREDSPNVVASAKRAAELVAARQPE